MEFGPYVNYAVAAAIVLALLLIAMFVLRAVGGRVRARQGSRLSVSEYQEIDKQRHLVLVRRDGVEHLLMIGGPQDVVIETGITSAGVAAGDAMRFDPGRMPPVHELRQAPVVPRVEPEEPRTVPLRAAPRPAVFGDRAPDATRQQRAEPRLEPVVKKPEEGASEEA